MKMYINIIFFFNKKNVKNVSAKKILGSQSLKSNQVVCNKVFWETFRCCVSIVIPKGHLKEHSPFLEIGSFYCKILK